MDAGLTIQCASVWRDRATCALAMPVLALAGASEVGLNLSVGLENMSKR
jgi:hypothetical protein